MADRGAYSSRSASNREFLGSDLKIRFDSQLTLDVFSWIGLRAFRCRRVMVILGAGARRPERRQLARSRISTVCAGGDLLDDFGEQISRLRTHACKPWAVRRLASGVYDLRALPRRA